MQAEALLRFHLPMSRKEEMGTLFIISPKSYLIRLHTFHVFHTYEYWRFLD
jgi:hypothetical protein